jgi:hypothetical protein
MARRAGFWVLGGATAAAGALIARPEAYRWLRRTAGLGEAEAATTPEQLPAAHDDAADEAFDTREARLSLRARLHEAEVPVQAAERIDDEPAAEAAAEPEATVAPVKVAVGVGAGEKPARKINSRPRPAREPAEPLRRNVEEARTRMRNSARKAAQENGPAA